MQVHVTPDGRIHIDAAPREAATLAGRPFMDALSVMGELRDRVAEAWYRADCPPSCEFEPVEAFVTPAQALCRHPRTRGSIA